MLLFCAVLLLIAFGNRAVSAHQLAPFNACLLSGICAYAHAAKPLAAWTPCGLCNVLGTNTILLQRLQMLMDLGPVVYVEDFEKHFLAKASEFYQVLLANEGFALTTRSSSNKRCLLPCVKLAQRA